MRQTVAVVLYIGIHECVYIYIYMYLNLFLIVSIMQRRVLGPAAIALKRGQGQRPLISLIKA